MLLKRDQPVLTLITAHPLSVVGACLVTTAAICWILALPAQVRGHVTNPYIGILLFVLLPRLFLGGLALIPAGVYLARRRVRKGLADVVVDRPTSIRRLGAFLAVTTFLNLVIGSQLTYRAVEHMESDQFCGQTCHVMTPQFTAYKDFVHSRVLCVDCHVASGASGWFESKLAGTRQLLAVALDNYPRPIQSAMESNRLVPATETCEQCHWPQIGGTVRLRIIPNYKEDEQNTPSHSVLLMRISGATTSGIHGSHFGPGVHIQYAASDPKRQTIPWVEYRNDSTGTVRTYLAGDTKADKVVLLPKYEMQCVDCHNRPAHAFELPERAVNRAMATGGISATLPFVKKTSLELLKQEYESHEVARQKIVEGLQNYYRTEHSAMFAQRLGDIEGAAKAVSSIYARNVFPDLKVSWGTYPNNLGHTDFPGCFRCHDESHTTVDQKSITQDCTSCHELLAVDEPAPEVLKTLNLSERIGELQRR
jgi:nitrate/TMAO reductase-like tetraheme cytochrome c subunit